MRLKFTLLISIFSTCFTTPALAEQQHPLQPMHISIADIQHHFEPNSIPIKLTPLSQKEMKETDGAIIWFAPVLLGGARFAITGFTRHGLNQVISRSGVGVSNQAMLSTLRNPSTAYSNIANRTTRYVGSNATVIVNQSGRVVTAWGRPR